MQLRPWQNKMLTCLSMAIVSISISAVTALVLSANYQSNIPDAVLRDEISEPSLSIVPSEETFEASPVISAPKANTSGYESLGTFTLTAYCPCVMCCGEWSAEHPSHSGTDYVQKTTSGTIPTAGRTIGVDPRIIPLGTTVVINGHEYIAEDCGGAIKGQRIDVFCSNHAEALAFGRQTAEVFIKK